MSAWPQEKTQEADLKALQLKDKDMELETKLAEISRLKVQIQTHESEITTQVREVCLFIDACSLSTGDTARSALCCSVFRYRLINRHGAGEL